MSLLKRSLQLFLGLVLLLILAIYLDIIWLLAPFYDVKQYEELREPIMDMIAYEEIWGTHRRPYIFSVTASNEGGVWVMGVDHTKDPNDAQLDSIRYYWDTVQPTFALAEGRIGNLIRYLQDPVIECGEGGLLRQLADDSSVPIYSWEPRRDTEIAMLMRDFPVEQLAMFYTFRPYFSNMRFGKPSDPESALQDYLKSRTDYDYLRGVFESWSELDSMWQADYPGLSWRDYSDGSGWPRGYLHDIWNRSNVARDEHMVQIILEQVSAGEKVIVTMGSSHAPRIEKTLRSMF